MQNKPVTPAVEEAHRALSASLPFAETSDFDDADRGFLAALVPGAVRRADGQVVWDSDTYGFLAGEAPTSVHPSLWRQSQLVAKQGLYEVSEGIYQVRGLDLSNITFVEGDTGIIVIDPLISTETAAAALGLYREHRGEAPRRRRDLLAQPRRSLRRRLRRHHRGRCRVREGAGHRPRGIRRARGRRERLRGHRDVATRGVHVRSGARTRSTGSGRRGARADRVQRRGGASSCRRRT